MHTFCLILYWFFKFLKFHIDFRDYQSINRIEITHIKENLFKRLKKEKKKNN